MVAMTEHQLNQQAFRQLRDFIQGNYPPGRFVAIATGKIIADAATFADLDAKLIAIGQETSDILVVQAGVDYPDSAFIFMQASKHQHLIRGTDTVQLLLQCGRPLTMISTIVV